MPEFIGEALAAAGTFAADVGGEIGAAAGGVGEALGMGGEVAAAADPVGMAALDGGISAGGMGSGLGELATSAGGAGGGGLESSISAFAPQGPQMNDISSLDWIGPGGDMPGPFNPGNAAGTDLAATGGATAGGNAGGLGVGGAGGGMTELTSLTGGPTSGVAAGGAATGGAGAGAETGMAELAGTEGSGGLMSSITNSVMKNPAGIAMAGAGLGYNILKGSQTSQNEKNVQDIANGMNAQGQQLQRYLQNGTLPPGMQAGLDNAKAAAKAQIISGYAARGQSADPNMNSALAQELAAVDTNSLELQGKIATNLLQAGINETNMSANLFQALIQMDATQAKSMGSAISNFATALGGGPKVIALGGGATA